MSWWTHIEGTIMVQVPGRTQPEIEYILKTILDHLPRVTGSEGDMEVHIVKHNEYNGSSSCDELGCETNNLVDTHGCKSHRGWLETQDEYSLLVIGNLRDRHFDETYREFMKWFCRLAKRLWVKSILVRIRGDYDKSVTIDINDRNNHTLYSMHESPSWSCDNKEHEPAWWEHLMWETWDYSCWPLSLLKKYYDDPEVDEAWDFKMKCREEGNKRARKMFFEEHFSDKKENE